MRLFSKKQRRFIVIALAIGLVLFIITAWKSNPLSILATLGTFTFWHFLAIICTFLIQFIFSSISIALILKRLDHKIGIKHLFPLQLLKFSISYVTPFSNNGGEPAEIYILKKKYHTLYSKATAAVILEIILKLSVSLLIMAIGCIYILFAKTLIILKVISLLFFAFFLLIIIIFFYYTIKKKGCLMTLGRSFGLHRLKIYQSKGGIIRNIDRCTIHFFHRYPRDFALTVLLAFLAISCFIVRFYLIFLFLGYSTGIIDMILIFSLTQGLILVPIPTLLGVHEAGQGLLSLFTQIPLQIGISFVIILRLVSLIMTIPGFILLGHYGINTLGRRLKKRISLTLNHKTTDKKIAE